MDECSQLRQSVADRTLVNEYPLTVADVLRKWTQESLVLEPCVVARASPPIAYCEIVATQPLELKNILPLAPSNANEPSSGSPAAVRHFFMLHLYISFQFFQFGTNTILHESSVAEELINISPAAAPAPASSESETASTSAAVAEFSFSHLNVSCRSFTVGTVVNRSSPLPGARVLVSSPVNPVVTFVCLYIYTCLGLF